MLVTLQQHFILSWIFKGMWEFAEPLYVCLVHSEKAFDYILGGLVGELQVYSLVHTGSEKSNSLPVGVGFHQSFPEYKAVELRVSSSKYETVAPWQKRGAVLTLGRVFLG